MSVDHAVWDDFQHNNILQRETDIKSALHWHEHTVPVEPLLKHCASGMWHTSVMWLTHEPKLIPNVISYNLTHYISVIE